jgi:hypothetical protein
LGAAVAFWLAASAVAILAFTSPSHGDVFLAEDASASHGSYGASAMRYGRAEYIRVIAIVVTPFELSNIQRQIFAADFVEAAHDAAFQERPKAVDSLSVDRAVDVLASVMPNGAMFLQLVSGMFVSRNQADFFGDRFADKTVQRCGIGVLDDASNDVAFALNSAHNGVLAFSTSPWSALIPMSVSVLAADVSFIDFDNANQLTEIWIGQPGSDAMTHIEGGRIGAKTHHAMNLQRRNSLLASQHQIDGLEPNSHRNIGVFKDRPDQDGKAISLRRTGWAFPFEWHRFQCIYAVASTVWATNAVWPAPRNEIRFASVIRRKQLVELGDGHLSSEFWGAHGSDLRV